MEAAKSLDNHHFRLPDDLERLREDNQHADGDHGKENQSTHMNSRACLAME
jgi:hypothetical protein